MKLTEGDLIVIKNYGHLFNSTGGNDIVELIERKGVNYFNNPIVAELQGCCTAQLNLIKKLIAEDYLPLGEELNKLIDKNNEAVEKDYKGENNV